MSENSFNPAEMRRLPGDDPTDFEARYRAELDKREEDATLRRMVASASEQSFANAQGLSAPDEHVLAPIPDESQVDPSPKMSPADASLPVAGLAVPSFAVQSTPRDKEIYDSVYQGFVDVPGAVARGAVFDFPANVVGFAEDLFEQMPPVAIDYGLAWYNDTEPPNYAKFAKDMAGSVREGIENLPGNTEGEESAIGDFARGVAAFTVPFLKIRNVMMTAHAAARGIPVSQMPVSGRIAVDASAGWAADMLFKQEQVLANLMRENETLAKVIPEAMAIGPDDSEWAKRVKGSLEGVPLGLALDAFVEGLRWVRRAIIARAAARGEKVTPKTYAEMLEAEHGTMTPEDLDRAWGELPAAPEADGVIPIAQVRLGEAVARPAATGMKVPLTPGQFEGSDVAARFDDYAAYLRDFRQLQQRDVKALYVNMGRIDSEEDVVAFVREFIEADGEAIREAKRIGRGAEGALAEAEAAGPMTVAELLSRVDGQPLSDTAARRAGMLMDLTNRKLIHLMKKAAHANAGTIDEFNFQKMLYIWKAVREQFEGSKADASRALNIFKHAEGPSGGMLAEEVHRVVSTLNSGGNPMRKLSHTQRLARELDEIMTDGGPIEKILDRAIEGNHGRINKIFRETIAMGLLWGPKTHLKNIGSNAVVATMDPMQRTTAALWRDLIGGEGVEMAEVRAQVFAQTEAIGAAQRAVRKMLSTGASEFSEMTGRAPTTKFDDPIGAWSANSLGVEDPDSALAKGLDMFAAIHTAPGIALKAQDEFFKVINFQGQLAALVARDGQQRAVKEGWTSSQLADYIAHNMNLENTPKSFISEAAASAERLTFTNHASGAITQAVRGMREAKLFGLNPMFVLVPYLNTPANIMNYTFEFTPGLGPISKHWRQEFAAGGARRDMAIGSQVVGAMMFASALDIHQNGYLIGEGPYEPGLMNAIREAGGDKNSVFVPPSEDYPEGQWVSFNDLDQHALTFALAAQLGEMYRTRDIRPEHYDTQSEMVGAIVMSIANSSTDRSYMQASNDLVVAISEQNRAAWERFVISRAQSLVPFSSALRQLENLVDPKFAYTPTLVGTLTVPSEDGPRDIPYAQNAILPLIPWVASMYPQRKDMWGKDWVDDHPVMSRMVPFRRKTVKPEPIERVMLELGWGPQRKSLTQHFQLARAVRRPDGSVETSVQVNLQHFPRVFERYQELAGHEPTIGGKSALERLNALAVTKLSNTRLPRDIRVEMIQKVMTDHSNQAKHIIMHDPEFAEFQEYVERQAAREVNRAFEISPGSQRAN